MKGLRSYVHAAEVGSVAAMATWIGQDQPSKGIVMGGVYVLSKAIQYGLDRRRASQQSPPASGLEQRVTTESSLHPLENCFETVQEMYEQVDHDQRDIDLAKDDVVSYLFAATDNGYARATFCGFFQEELRLITRQRVEGFLPPELRGTPRQMMRVAYNETMIQLRAYDREVSLLGERK